ncbi:MAG: ATP-binding cassette domain-containing protein, partial [Flavobacteriaceae bacterium]
MLNVENLTIGYLSDRGQKSILADRVNFSIGQNQLTAIIGPNGAGKSTLLNTLAGQ